MTARRIPALDWFRLAAVFLVVVNHTSPLGDLAPLADFWLARVLARLAVPFYLMVSGYFLAAKDWRGLIPFWRRSALVYLIAAVLYLPLNLYAGVSPGEWLRDFLWQGSFYHLWYFPALLWGVLIARGLARLGMPLALGAASLLYLVGLGGDSYYGFAAQVPALRNLYAILFHWAGQTRNGLFYAPMFLLLGAALAKRTGRQSARLIAGGFAAALTGMSAEGLWLHRLQVQRHDSMYLLLPVCMVLLFQLLLACNSGRRRTARDLALLVYLLHPGCIVAVRGLARLTGIWALLVDNSLVHFCAVLATSFAAGWLLVRLRPMPPPRDSRAWREVDADALRHNVQVLQYAAGANCRLMAVVKADAYGHGARQCARILQRAGVRDFAVACLSEGIALRKAGIRGNLLVLGWTDPKLAPLLSRWRLTQAVISVEHGQALAAQGCRVRVHLALDTGMHRVGIPAGDTAALAGLCRLPGLQVKGVFSHLCVSDELTPESEAYTRRQADAFRTAVEMLHRAGIQPGDIHLLASYGIWNYPEYHFDLVRAGIALYGVQSDASATRRKLDLQPVLALKARIAHIEWLDTGETAGYGRAFTAPRPTLLAVAAIGYADGLPRHLPERGGRVLVRGVSCPMVGRMCMDQLLVDVTQAPQTAIGDVVTLIGCEGGASISAEEVAQRCGTITNELLSRLGTRLPLLRRTEK